VWQRYIEPPVFDGMYPVVGSWIIGSTSHGMGIRESATPITDNRSPFVPHYFT
jgi:glutathionylspermidine synthase